MLQSASDWWYGTENKESSEDKEKNLENNDEKKDEVDDEEIEIEFKKELKSITFIDPVISLFKLIDFENTIKQLLISNFNNKLTEEELSELIALFNKIYKNGVKTKLRLKIYVEEIEIGEIILSYFAKVSHTNPGEYECWERWIKYRINKEISLKLAEVKKENLEKFINSQAIEIGYDNKGRLICFFSTKNYDGYIDADTQRKAALLIIQSFGWNKIKNEFDLNVLRKGILAHLNLSDFSINIAGWATISALKDLIPVHTWALKDIFIVNPPMLVYLVKTVAAQFLTEHSLDKFIFLESQQEFFQKYASKDKTPVVAEGTSNIVLSQWMKDRGYI